jgi:hypothetical protein
MFPHGLKQNRFDGSAQRKTCSNSRIVFQEAMVQTAKNQRKMKSQEELNILRLHIEPSN